MFRSVYFIQYAFLLAIGFVSGVICFQAFSLDKSMNLIKLLDPRVLELSDVTLWQIFLPIIVWGLFVLFFTTHPYLHFFAKLVVAVKATFFGFGSVFLLTQQESILVYSVWWFPFQLIYCILLLALCSVFGTRKAGPNRKFVFNKKLFFTLAVAFTIMGLGEIMVISYIIN
ncbi:hypothetical protein ACFPN4_10935 [Ureibacillus thermophilus]|uniref:hypothetical protein n=1 Tax=Ureibacillus thermophilus TaxID=367743 RepID=UPI0036103C4B